MSVEGVLAKIDAALGGICSAPGCVRWIGAGSPSAWWCSEECYVAYHSRTADALPETVDAGWEQERWEPRYREWAPHHGPVDPDPFQVLRGVMAEAARYSTRSERVVVGAGLWRSLLRIARQPEDLPSPAPGNPAWLYGIPIIVDDELPPDSWRLVQRPRARYTIQ